MNKKERWIWAISIIAGLAFVIFGVYIYRYPIENFMLTWLDMEVIGVLAFLAGPGIYDMIERRRIKAIEERFPDFLRDVAEAGRFGMTLAESIVVASSGRYGALTDEIKRMAAKIKWGVPVKDALLSFNQRINTPLINRMIAIIIKANEAGGNVADVLSMVSHAAKETQLMQKERGIEMFTYAFVILTSFFVFVATIIILNNSFMPEMAKAGKAVEESLAKAAVGGNLPVGGIAYREVPIISFLFVLATLIHGFGDGIMIGLLNDGRFKTGMVWAFILLASGYFILRAMGAA